MYIGIKPPFGEKTRHHITLAFCGKASTKRQYLKAIEATAAAAYRFHENGNGGIDVQFARTVGLFMPQWCWYAPVTSYRHKLHRFQEMLVEELDDRNVFNSKDFAFTPHLTLGYGGGTDKDGGLGYVYENIENPYRDKQFRVEQLLIIDKQMGVSTIQLHTDA